MPMASSETNRHENHVIETIHGESKDLPWVLVAALTLRSLGSLPLDLVAVRVRTPTPSPTDWRGETDQHSQLHLPLSKKPLPTASRCQHPPMHNSWQINWRGTKCCEVGTTRNRNHRTGAQWPTHTLWVPPGVCGSWPLLAVWDPRFSWVHRQPTTHAGSLLECAAPGRSSQCGTRGFPGLTANPQHMLGPSWSVRLLAAPRSVGPAVFLGSPPTHNTCWVPPGVCGSWPLLAVWDPRFSWAHRQPTTHAGSLLECAAPGRSSQCGTRSFPTHPTCSYRNANSCLDQQKEVRECNSATTAANVHHNLTHKEITNTCGVL